MKLSKRWIGFGALAIAAIALLTLIMAPGSNQQTRGSTFSSAPDGYGAWVAYMQRQGDSVQRWQKPLKDFWTQHPGSAKSPVTLLQINGRPTFEVTLDKEEESWLAKGNTLVVLGVQAPATRAAFSTEQPSSEGAVKIETSRRYRLLLRSQLQQLLGDSFGATVWQQKVGSGQLIQATTPHLAANAYQGELGNFAFLAQLVKQTNHTIWVDEYLHGYRDAETIKTEKDTANDWAAYLAKTPLLLIAIQAGVLLLILIWANNRRFGRPVPLKAVAVDNSEAYIQAMAAVLHKGNRSEFVLDTVSKEEQLQIQRSLGLGETQLEPEAVIAAWQQQTNQPATEISQVLQPRFKKQRATEQDLQTWLTTVKSLRQKLPGNRGVRDEG